MADERPLTVLLLEDDFLVRADIADQFAEVGWRVIEAVSGERAVELFKRNPVQVFVTDIQLTGKMTGWDVAEELRLRQPDLPVVYTSGNKPIASRQVPESAFFIKRYEPTAVVAACKKLLASAQKGTAF